MKRGFWPFVVLLLVSEFLCAQDSLGARGSLGGPDGPPAPLELYRGAVTVDIIMGRGIAAGVDLPADGKLVGDGVFDRLIVLEAFGTIPPELPLVLPDAYVAVSAGRGMVVEVGGARVVDLIVDQARRPGMLDSGKVPSQVRLARGWSGDDERMVFHGIGLASAVVQARVIDDGSWADRPYATRDACDSSATSCSISCQCSAVDPTCATSCSITCGGGDYACCRCQGGAIGADCSCLLSGGGGGGAGSDDGGSGACSSGAGGCPAACFNCAAY